MSIFIMIAVPSFVCLLGGIGLYIKWRLGGFD